MAKRKAGPNVQRLIKLRVDHERARNKSLRSNGNKFPTPGQAIADLIACSRDAILWTYAGIDRVKANPSNMLNDEDIASELIADLEGVL